MRIAWPCLVAALTIGIGVAPARAAGEGLAQAKAAIALGDTEKATEILDKLLAENPNAAQPLLLRGNLRLDSRDWSGALDDYEKYLAVAPRGAQKRKISKLVTSLADVRTSTFELTVEGGATVYLDSKSLGVFCVAAPVCKKNVLPGDHRLILEQDGYEKVTVPVSFLVGQLVELKKPLVSKPSRLAISAQPPEATIRVNGVAYSAATEVPSGEYQVEVELAGHQTQKVAVTAKAAKPIDLQVVLNKFVTLSNMLPQGSILLDGKASQPSDGKLLVPADGKPHTVEFSAPEYNSKTVTIEPAAIALDAKLRKTNVVVTVDKLRAESAAISIDGAKQPKGEWTLPSGEHSIVVKYKGVSSEKKVDLEDNVTLRVQGRKAGMRWPAYLGLGVGAVGLTLGGVAGLRALDFADQYNAHQEKAFAAKNDPISFSLRRNRNQSSLIATTGFVAAGLGLGTAAYFLLFKRGPKDSSVQFDIGPTSVGISGKL